MSQKFYWNLESKERSHEAERIVTSHRDGLKELGLELHCKRSGDESVRVSRIARMELDGTGGPCCLSYEFTLEDGNWFTSDGFSSVVVGLSLPGSVNLRSRAVLELTCALGSPKLVTI